MSLLFGIGLWCVMWLAGTEQVSPILPNCSVAKEATLLPSPNRTLYGRGQHLRRGDVNVTELNTTQLPMEDLRSSRHTCSQRECVMGFLTCVIREHTLSRFIFFVFTLGLFGNRILFLCLLFCMKWSPFTVHVWNFAITDIGALVFLGSNFLFFSIDYIRGDSSDDLVVSFLLLAYLFLFMQCTTIHFLTAISIDWCLVVLFPTCHPSYRPKYISDLISAIVPSLLWALSSLLLFFFQLGVDTQTIAIVSAPFFAPLTVSLTLTLILKVWRNLGEQGKLYKEIVLAMLFSLVTLVPLRLFFALHKSLETIPSLVLLFMALSSTNAPLHYMIVWKIGLPSP